MLLCFFSSASRNIFGNISPLAVLEIQVALKWNAAILALKKLGFPEGNRRPLF